MDLLAELIAVAQSMLDGGGFDPQVFLMWQILGFLVLLGCFGPFHYYTENFRRLTSEKDKRGLLAGEGILVAAKETMTTGPTEMAHGTGAGPDAGSVNVTLPTHLLDRLRHMASTCLGTQET